MRRYQPNRRAVPFLQEIAGLLPAEDVVRRVAPRAALEVDLPGEETQEQRRVVETPRALALCEHLAEKALSLAASQETLLKRGLRAATIMAMSHIEAGRYPDACPQERVRENATDALYETVNYRTGL